MSDPRNRTRPVTVGSIFIGGNHPVSVQTMWKQPAEGDPLEAARQVDVWGEMGCGLVRFAVPDGNAVDFVGTLSENTSIPIVADIHFDYKLALSCMDYNIAKIRINPGNLGARWKAKEVLAKAADTGKSVRVGINGGSLPRNLRKENNICAALLQAAEEEIDILEESGFGQAVFSLKTSDLEAMVEANIEFSSRYDYPLHIGMTEAGPLVQGLVRNSIGISRLLQRGIGDTVRVSLSDTPENEIIAGKSILSAENLYSGGVHIVSCPTCSRRSFPVHEFLAEIEEELQQVRKDLTVAVMGCEVNGPEESKHADLGITGAGNSVLIFRHGKIIARTDMRAGKEKFLQELKGL